MGPVARASTHDDAPKREAILDAALELFTARGFHGTAVPLIAEKAGVGAGTLYRYFESKEAIVNALYQQWKARMAHGLFEGLPADVAPRVMFHEIWKRLGEFARKYPRALAFLELHHHGEYLDEKSRQIEMTVLAPLYAFVYQAQKDFQLKPMLPEAMMAIVYGAFVGLIRANWDNKLKLDQDVLDQAETCIWEAIRQ